MSQRISFSLTCCLRPQITSSKSSESDNTVLHFNTYISRHPEKIYFFKRVDCVTVTVLHDTRLCLHNIPHPLQPPPPTPFLDVCLPISSLFSPKTWPACMPGQHPAFVDPVKPALDGPLQQPEQHHHGPRKIHRLGIHLGHNFAGRSHRSRARDRRRG